MSTKWLQRPVDTRTFDYEGKTYTVHVYPASDDPTHLEFEALVDGKPVPIPDHADEIMQLLRPDEQRALSQAVEHLLQSQTQGSSSKTSD